MDANSRSVRHNRAAILVAVGAVLLVVLVIAGSLLVHRPFSPTGSMVAARSQHTATLLSDGRVLIVGGDGGAESQFLDSAELYDPKTGTFSATGSMTTGRSGQTATLLADGRVLIIGGIPGLTSAELYDPRTGTFTGTGSMTTARSYYTATLLRDGRVLVTGGGANGAGGGIASAELYDPRTGMFVLTGSMSTPRVSQTATLLTDGRVLVAGGNDGTGAAGGLASAELYDPTTGRFSPTSSMNTPRENQTATLLTDGRVLVAGGAAFDANGRPMGNGPLASAELYDPHSGRFIFTGSMTLLAENYTATLLADGRVLFAGGDDGSGSLAAAEIYDSFAGTFSSIGSMAAGRVGHTATLLADGRVLIAGGQPAGNSNSGTPLASAETYLP
jgi:Kelch motif